MQFPAKVTAQLHDGIWGPYDCWVASTRGLIAFASNGDVHLDYVTVRKRAGRFVDHPTKAQLDDLGPGNLDDIKAVLKHPETVAQFKAAGLKPPKLRYLGTTKAATVFSYLLQGYQAAVAIDYATIKAMRPKATGDPNFDGNHSVRWYGAYDKQGKPKAALTAPFLSDQLDPLNDGRRSGIADGPQRINRAAMIAAAGEVKFHDANGNVIGEVGKGNVLALVVRPAQRVGGAGVNPDEDPKAQLAAAKARIADLEDERQDILDALDGDAALDIIRQILSGKSNANDPTVQGVRGNHSLVADPAVDGDDQTAEAAENKGVDKNDD
jgi:hypothetical protein